MKTFLIIILSIGILLQFYFGDKEITKWRALARENHIEHYNCIGDKVDLAEARDNLTKENELYRDSLNQIMIDCTKIVYNAWEAGYATAWTHKYDKTLFNEQMKKDRIWFLKQVSSQ